MRPTRLTPQKTRVPKRTMKSNIASRVTPGVVLPLPLLLLGLLLAVLTRKLGMILLKVFVLSGAI